MSGPTGTVTFLFTDVEGSTRRWESDPEAMSRALARHDQLLRGAIAEHGGHVFATGGDGFAAVFTSADDAVGAARAAHRSLEQERAGDDAFDISVRMGLHTGTAEERDGDYFGPTVNRAARIMAAGHGGQILVSHHTATMLTDTSGLHDLGEHRLRDLLEAAHLHLVDTAPADHPPLRTLDRLDHNLPVLRSAVFGLDDTIEAIRQALADHGVVTLTGMGGVGKTRLALEVAARAGGDHELTRFVDLSRVSDGADVVQAVAAALGLEAPDRDSIVSHLGVRDSLLVVDNCEHVIDDVCDLLDVLLPRCPDCTVLATSREPLGVDGELVRPVRSLAEEPAVELFVDRALAVRSDFDVAGAREAIGEICERLDGIPLAIELAAARVSHMHPREIAAHLDERFTLLSGGRRRARQRQQTLQATMDWSYDLLDDDEQSLLRAAAVFTGGFDAEAAAAVWGRPTVEALGVLGSLVDRSLLTVSSVEGASRYGMLETVRLYAQERLVAAGESEKRRALHADHCERVLTEAPLDELVWDSLGPTELSRRTPAELSNYVSVFDWLHERGDLARLGRLAPRVVLQAEGLTWADDDDRYFGRADVAEALDDDERGLYWAASSMNANVVGRFEDQLQFGERALETATGPVRVLAIFTVAMGAVIFDPHRVDELVEEGLKIVDPDRVDVQRTLRSSRLHRMTMTGDFDGARRELDARWRALHARDPSESFQRPFADVTELFYVELVPGRDDRVLELCAVGLGDLGSSPFAARAECAAAVVTAKRGDPVESARRLLRAFEELDAVPMRLLHHEFTIAAALRSLHLGDPVHACRLLATVPIRLRSPSAYQLLQHARRLVGEHLSRDEIDAIRAEMADVDPVAVRRGERARLRTEVAAATDE